MESFNAIIWVVYDIRTKNLLTSFCWSSWKENTHVIFHFILNHFCLNKRQRLSFVKQEYWIFWRKIYSRKYNVFKRSITKKTNDVFVSTLKIYLCAFFRRYSYSQKFGLHLHQKNLSISNVKYFLGTTSNFWLEIIPRKILNYDWLSTPCWKNHLKFFYPSIYTLVYHLNGLICRVGNVVRV